jgi:hypothetical protein
MKLNPMSTFGPEAHCFLYDGTNHQALEWVPQDAGNWRKWAEPWSDDPRFMHFHGLLLGGWGEREFKPDELEKVPA